MITSNIVQTESVLHRNIYIYIHACNNNEKSAMFLKDSKHYMWEGLKAGKIKNVIIV